MKVTGLAAAVGIILGAYASFFFGLYWLMQPSVATNPGLAGYRPPPKTVVSPLVLIQATSRVWPRRKRSERADSCGRFLGARHLIDSRA
jgi:hypothetical protein